MDKKWIGILLVVVYLLLSNNKVNEGYENTVNEGYENTNGQVEETVEETVEEKDPDGEENCEYRKKLKGNMCNEKWGEPRCSSWEIPENIKKISKRKQTVLKGYYPNDFMYEIDYEEYSTTLLEEDDTDKNDTDKNEPRGVHSSFFS